MLADDVEEIGAVLLELGFADAVHGCHLGRRRRLAPRHVNQCPVGEHHVGRDTLRFGQRRAALAERLEQRGVARRAVGKRRGVGSRARGFSRGRFERVLT